MKILIIILLAGMIYGQGYKTIVISTQPYRTLTFLDNVEVSGDMKIKSGNPGVNKILFSKTNDGLVEWRELPELGGGDNLGNHIATTTLNMSGYNIVNINTAYMDLAKLNRIGALAGLIEIYGEIYSTECINVSSITSRGDISGNHLRISSITCYGRMDIAGPIEIVGLENNINMHGGSIDNVSTLATTGGGGIYSNFVRTNEIVGRDNDFINFSGFGIKTDSWIQASSITCINDLSAREITANYKGGWVNVSSIVASGMVKSGGIDCGDIFIKVPYTSHNIRITYKNIQGLYNNTLKTAIGLIEPGYEGDLALYAVGKVDVHGRDLKKLIRDVNNVEQTQEYFMRGSATVNAKSYLTINLAVSQIINVQITPYGTTPANMNEIGITNIGSNSFTVYNDENNVVSFFWLAIVR